MKEASQIGVLMISLDGQLADPSSDVAGRHQAYAQNLKFLDIIVLGGRTRIEQRLSENCRVYWTGSKGWGGLLIGLKLAKKYVHEHQPDLVDTQDPHATGWIGWRLKKAFSLPLEVHFHGDFWENKYWLRESWKNVIFNHWQKKIVPQADAIRVTSVGIKDKLVAYGLAAAKITVINTPINQAYFQSPATGSRSNTLLFVGRFEEAKNIIFMLNCLASLWQTGLDFNLIMVGAGSLDSSIMNWVKARNLSGRIQVLGWQKTPELIRLYNSCRALLLLSTNESFGKVIVEAGLQGLPTIASRTVGASTVIKDKQTGWLAPINDEAATENLIRMILERSDLAQSAGERARQNYIERFDPKLTIKAISDYWLEIINRYHHATLD